MTVNDCRFIYSVWIAVVLRCGKYTITKTFIVHVAKSMFSDISLSVLVVCRFVTCVCVSNYQGSQYASNSNSAYDLFLTSAITDGLKLWDLRSNRFIS